MLSPGGAEPLEDEEAISELMPVDDLQTVAVPSAFFAMRVADPHLVHGEEAV